MKKDAAKWMAVALATVLAAGCGKREAVTVASMAERLADPLELARLDGPDTVLHSSWDRTGGNDDWGTFLRDSETPGWKVVAELEGPGVLSRFWFTGAKDGKPHRFRFYFDGEESPRFEGDVKEWCGGGMSPFLPPLAEYRNYCWYSFVPMPYAKGLRVECEAGPAGAKPYYQLSERRLPKGTRVETFSWPLPERDVAALERVRECWGGGGGPEGEMVAATLTKESPALRLEGAGVIRRLEFEPDWAAVAPEERDGLLREYRVGVRYGGRSAESVWAPLGDLCGMPWRRVRAGSLWFGMEGESLFCAFPMPFDNGAEVWVEAGRPGLPPVKVRAWRTELPKGGMAGLGYFHAAWKRSGPGDAGKPHPILHAQGSGKYVGCLLGVCAMDGSYWTLEGDETIRKDGERAPGWRGTGLEDYFNGGWYYQNPWAGPTHGLFVKEPFRTVQYRVHAMDPSLFRQSFDMEFERGPQQVSPAFFESVAWYYMEEPQKADSTRLAAAYRKAPADSRLDPLNGMTAAWNAERFGDWAGAAETWSVFAKKHGAGWPERWRRLAELRSAAYAAGGVPGEAALRPFLEDADGEVRRAAEIMRKEGAGEGVTALLYANMPAEVFIDGTRVLQGGNPEAAEATSVALAPGEHAVAIRTALQAYPDWVLLALRKGEWFAGTTPEWRFAINPPAAAVGRDFDDGGWPEVGGTGGKGPPEEPYVRVVPDPWVGMQSRAVGIRPGGDKPAAGTVVYRGRVLVPGGK